MTRSKILKPSKKKGSIPSPIILILTSNRKIKYNAKFTFSKISAYLESCGYLSAARIAVFAKMTVVMK